MNKKKLLFLGGSYFQVPAIIRAKEMGYYVITADYLPSNPGHKFSNEYYNISTTDREKILELAQNVDIDGIIAYASDPAAIVAAFVATKLSLPSSPLESIEILGKKQLWNKFLKENNFNVPQFLSGSTICEIDVALLNFPLIVKPVDSSGSKGVSRINSAPELKEAFEYAQSFSKSKTVIVEEFIDMEGYLIGGDGFFGTDQLEFVCYGDVYANNKLNPLIPAGFSIPSRIDKEIEIKISEEINRLFRLLQVKNLSFNLEVMIAKNGAIFLKEMGPRNGGYFVPQIIQYYSKVNLVDFALKSAMEKHFKIKNPVKIRHTDNYYGFYVIHSEVKAIFEKISYALPLGVTILEEHIFTKKGMQVDQFTGSNRALGVVLFQFENYNSMDNFYREVKNYIKIDFIN